MSAIGSGTTTNARKRALVALCTFAIVSQLISVALASKAQSSCPVAGQIVTEGRWEHIKVPEFPSGPPALTHYGVDGIDPTRLLVTNGVVVLLSEDAGCTWRTTFDLANPPDGSEYSAADSEIVDLSMGSGQALLAIAQGRSARPHILLSSYGGQTWRSGNDGLEATTGRPLQVAFTGTNSQYVHLLLEGGTGDPGASTGYAVLQSATAGASWQDRGGNDPSVRVDLPVVGSIGGQGHLVGMVADARDAGRVYLYGPAGLFSYQAGDKTKLLDADLGTVSAQPTGPQGTRVLAATTAASTVYMSTDAGLTFGSFNAPGTVDSFAVALDEDDYHVAAADKVFTVDNGVFREITPSDGRAITDLSAARSLRSITPFRAVETLTLYGRTDNTLERTSDQRAVNTPGALDSVVVGEFPPLNPETKLPGSLTPATTEVILKEGESRTLPYRLYLPKTPTPLDVFFDVDVSGSMQEEIDGLRAAMSNIVTELSLAGIDAWFGAGEYRAFRDAPAYARLQDIAPPGDSLAQALNSMRAYGGGFETQLESLYQIATGEGSTVGVGIEPGQQTTWRTGTLRVIVHITDEPISTGEDHPSYEAVSKALINTGALHFGIAVQNELSKRDLGEPRPGLMQISRMSRSVAPSQGVDCDGDQQADLFAGEPLVCVVDPLRSHEASVMGTAIINVLTAVTDVGAVELTAEVKDSARHGRDIVAVPSATSVGGVDFKQSNLIDFNVTFTCPHIDKTARFPVTVAARREVGMLATAIASVTCRARPAPDEPRPPAPVLPVAAILPPLPRPPEVIPEPNPNPQPNPAHQAQAQPQGALATQEQEQPQLAYVTASHGQESAAVQKADEHQMSRIRRETGPTGADLLYTSSALSMAFAFGWVVFAREQARTQRIRR